MFKECLKNNIMPFIIDDEHKLFYYRGLREYNNIKGYLVDTCLSCQDKYQEIVNEIQISFKNHDNGQKKSSRSLRKKY